MPPTVVRSHSPYIFCRSGLSLHLDIRQVCPHIIATQPVSLTAPYLSATPDHRKTVIPTLAVNYYMQQRHRAPLSMPSPEGLPRTQRVSGVRDSKATPLLH